MNLILANTGSYPRIGDKPEEQILRKTIAAWERGEKTDSDLRAAENEVTMQVIYEQVAAGLDMVTDGQVRWYDPISHIAGKFEGVEINGLLRFFDTNFYFRQPVISGKIRRKESIVVDEFLFAKAVSPKPVKPVITGPYTLAKLSIVNSDHYRELSKLVEDFAIGISEEIKELSKARAEVIQVDEPAILRNPRDFDILKEALLIMNEAKRASKLALYSYFGDASSLYDMLQELPVDIIGLDFTYGRDLIQVILDRGSEKALGLGLIDGRNTKLENKEEVAKTIERLLPKIKVDISYLNPSCGLEFLPRDKAFEKLKNMTEIKKMLFQGEGNGTR
ncbi:MAG: methylcobamide--CoM methyltransferase [Deltaproteobacteria bacterium]|jgi:5-methyltetrahydropteroyltriglutamate--homocysteine methyltransferase|nr:MAG: methylcobamide--CoM methyltransferase [Deltaproteobacteria bacterium]